MTPGDALVLAFVLLLIGLLVGNIVGVVWFMWMHRGR